MSYRKICQSCSMPMDKPELFGSKRDGSASKDYCIYCYSNGTFIKPNMTLEEMQELVKEQMLKMNLSDKLVKRAVRALPNLKRWKYEAAIF